MHSIQREQKHELDKQLSVQRIVQEEKKLMEDRFRQDIDKMQTQTAKQI